MDPIKILEKLVKFPSYPAEAGEVAQGMKDCANYLYEFLENLGFSVNVDDLYNVTAEKNFNGEKTFLVNSHFDTVVPAKDWDDALIPRRKGNMLYGLGASDAKGGIAATLSALSQLKESRFAKLIIQFANYEDNSITYRGRRWLGVPFFLSRNPSFTADYGVNVEPTVVGDEISLRIGCTGRLAFTVRTIGREAHSSIPQTGKNAIYDMMKAIEALRKIPPGKYDVNGYKFEMPINVAKIEGGREINIVPGECKIFCERRLFPGESPEKIRKIVESALKQIKHVETECTFNRAVQLPYAISRDEEIVSLLENTILKTVGYSPAVRITLGRTDSTYLYHQAGIKTAIVGPGHTGHIKNEFIYIDKLVEFTRIMRNLLHPPE